MALAQNFGVGLNEGGEELVLVGGEKLHGFEGLAVSQEGPIPRYADHPSRGPFSVSVVNAHEIVVNFGPRLC